MNYETKIQRSKQELEQAQNREILMSFKVLTLDDERVCSRCQKHEGVKIDDVYDAVIGVNHPPFHEGCRCFATYAMEGIRKQEDQEPVIQQKKSLGMRIKEKFKLK